MKKTILGLILLIGLSITNSYGYTGSWQDSQDNMTVKLSLSDGKKYCEKSGFFLPSLDDLKKLYHNKNKLKYSSDVGYLADNGDVVNFKDGSVYNSGGYAYHIRCKVDNKLLLQWKKDYSEVLIKNDIKSYKSFIKKYPDRPQVKDAKQKLYKLEYQNTSEKNTVEAYEKFINTYPNASQIEDAMKNMYTFEDLISPKTIKGDIRTFSYTNIINTKSNKEYIKSIFWKNNTATIKIYRAWSDERIHYGKRRSSRDGDTDPVYKLKTNNKVYRLNHVTGYPRYISEEEYEKNGLPKGNQYKFGFWGSSSGKVSGYAISHIQEGEVELNFNNIPSKALRKFDLYEIGCERKGFDECNVKISLFNEEIKQDKLICQILSKYDLSKKTLDSLKKVSNNYDTYPLVNNLIAKAILEKIIPMKSIIHLHEYNNSYRKHKDLLNRSTNNIYTLTKKKNNIAGYEWFIKNYPKAPQVNEAINNIHKLAYAKATSINTISAYNTFIYTYPTAPQVRKANDKAYKLEVKKYTDLGTFGGFFEKEAKLEKKARKLLIKAKQIERTGQDYSNNENLGYLIVANRMYELLQEKFDDSDATLRHLESQEFQDFIQVFKKNMKNLNKTLQRIEGNTEEIARYSKAVVNISQKGFEDAKADRSMEAYYTQQHRDWEKYMHYKDKGYQ